jgi:hypothetical protein
MVEFPQRRRLFKSFGATLPVPRVGTPTSLGNATLPRWLRPARQAALVANRTGGHP